MFQRQFFLVSAVLFFMAVIVTAGNVDGDINKRFNVRPGGTLTIETDIGSIQVESGNGNAVVIEVLFTPRNTSTSKMKTLLEDFEISFNQSGSDVEVRAEYDRRARNLWRSFGKYVRVAFKVRVPARYNADLKTSGGSISVDDLEGEVKSRTSGGSLDFGAIEGTVYGRTSGGSISVDRCTGSVDVNTSGGGITVGKVKGNVKANTSGGTIRIDEVQGSVAAATSGGSVSAAISEQPEQDCSLKTSGGSITVYLPENVNLNLDAATSGGSVSTDFPVTVKGVLSKRALKAKINEGGPELYLRTSGGSIYIKER